MSGGTATDHGFDCTCQLCFYGDDVLHEAASPPPASPVAEPETVEFCEDEPRPVGLWRDRLEALPADAPLRTLEVVLRGLQEEARGLDRLGRQLLREEAVGLLRRFDAVSSPAALVDAALASEKEDLLASGGPALFEDVEAYEEPVDGASLLEEIAALVRRYIALPNEHHVTAVALWIAYTWCFNAFEVAPRLAICSPTKRCGKTTLLAVLQALVRRPLAASNVTAAVVFRAIEAYKPTLLVDEADTFLRQNEELRGILNSGHFRPTARVLRCVGDDHEPVAFDTFAPAAFAAIGSLPDTLADRSIVLEMRRRTVSDAVEDLRLDRLGVETETLRRKLARLTSDRFDQLEAAEPTVPSALENRAADNWRPLLAVAEVAGGGWPERARAAAEALRPQASDEADVKVQLLADVKAIFEETETEELPTTEILDRLYELEDRPWPEYSRGKPLTPHGLARLLRGFAIRPRRRDVADTTVRYYRREDFEDAWRRYVQPEASVQSDGIDEVTESPGQAAVNLKIQSDGQSDGEAEPSLSKRRPSLCENQIDGVKTPGQRPAPSLRQFEDRSPAVYACARCGEETKATFDADDGLCPSCRMEARRKHLVKGGSP